MSLFSKDTDDGQGTVITITTKALRKALAVRDEEPDAQELALFVEVLEPQGFEYGYDLYFDKREFANPGDVVEQHEELTVVIAEDSVDALRGATIDLSRNLLNPGWVIQNPNTPSPAVGQSLDPSQLTGDVTERVQQVLEMAINPSIAQHGGRAELVAVEDSKAFMRLSGGCQGCGMAAVTLKQGIEVAIREAVPEVTEVVDVTDHEAGSNPYFEPAKK